MMRAGWWWVVAFMLWVIASKVLPFSALAIYPHAVEIVDGQVRVQRTFLADHIKYPVLLKDEDGSWEVAWQSLPRPRVSYVEKARGMSSSTNRGHPCLDSGGPFRYVNAEPVGSWSIVEWGEDCLLDSFGYDWEACWTWHLGGYTFGPVCNRTAVFQRVSVAPE
jgi:hypothetical protein